MLHTEMIFGQYLGSCDFCGCPSTQTITIIDEGEELQICEACLPSELEVGDNL